MSPKLLILAAGIFAALPASAHVKWFSKTANCITAPVTTLEMIASPLFWVLGALAMAAIAATTCADRRLAVAGKPSARAAAWLNERAAPWVAPLLRLGTLIYFSGIVLYFSGSPIILTAELKTSAAWVPVLQLAIAATAMFGRGALFSALGIVVLFAYGVSQYGLFHMLDYPFFLGLAAFLCFDSRSGRRMHDRALGILRLTVGVSLIWCGVEKWLYPAWTYELLQSDLSVLLTTGLSPELIIMGAGFVEFSLAFLLIFGRLSSQVAAAVLMTVMVSAIPVVGMVDLIGHLPILVVLVVLAATRNPIGGHVARSGKRWLEPGLAVSFMVSVPGFIGAYYLSHEIAYGVLGQLNLSEMGIAALLVAALLVRLQRIAPDLCRLFARTTPV